MGRKRVGYIVVFIFSILMIPLIAMQFTDEVNWTLMDFVVAGFLLLGLGLTIEFVFNRFKGSKYRIVIVVVVLFIFILIWAELAVGIFETRFGGN